MARAIIGGQYAVTGTATNVTDALSLAAGRDLKKLAIKNGKAAVNLVYLGDSDVAATPTNAHVELDANQGYEYWSGESHRINTNDVYIIGTANAANIVFINGIF